jgi:hypothetical protein
MGEDSQSWAARPKLRTGKLKSPNLISATVAQESALSWIKLRTLHLPSPARVIQNYIALEPGFSPLQELHIHMSHNSSAEIVRLSSRTLVKLGLRVCWYSERIDNKEPITFPRLLHLSYSCEGDSSFMVVELPEFITPVLECYQEFNNGLDRGLHQDTSSVTDLHIRSDRVIEWASFPRLTRVTVQKLPQSL